MDDNILYKDKLVEITSDSILFKNYYLFGGPKRVLFEMINSVVSVEPSVTTGKWRIWGTGNFTTWYPLDMNRSSRDTIFLLSITGKKVRIGFTVEDSKTVKQLLKEKKVFKDEIV